MDISDSTINRIAANAILAAARESGMNQTELANAADMSRITVQKLLSGNQGIKVAQFIALTSVTELTPADVMHRISAAIDRRLSVQADKVSDLDKKRAERDAKYNGEDFNEEVQPRAAVIDPEHEQDEQQ